MSIDGIPHYLSEADIDALVNLALEEDLGLGDVTTVSTIPPDTKATASFLAKESGTLAGLYVAQKVFHALDPVLEVFWSTSDGNRIDKGDVFGTVIGSAHAILSGERLALNIMQRMSGIATATHHMVHAASPFGARILDTRKTAPGLRLLDKWAVKLGGGENHRIGLFDMILIKDNHIAAAGGIQEAIQAAQQFRTEHDANLEIEVETRTLEEVEDALAMGGIDRLLLDNMVHLDEGDINTGMLSQAVKLVDGRYATEASGNVTLDTVPAIAATGVDFISSGALTHSVKALDISLKIALTI